MVIMPLLTPILLCFVLVVKNAGAAATPVVILTPNWNQFYVGDSVTLSCKLGSEKMSNYWRKEGHTVSRTKSYSMTVTKETAGIYRCYASRNVYSYPVTLYVIDNGDRNRPVVTAYPNWANIFEEEMMTLTCNMAKPAWEYVWNKDGNIIEQTNKELNIRSASYKHSGNYQCKSGNENFSSSVRLEVIWNADLILQAPSDVIEGDSIDLRCHSRSPDKEWATYFYKNNEQLKSSDHILHIHNVNTTMSGTYKCKKYVSSNEWTWAINYIYVQDLFTTPKINMSPYHAYPVREGDDVTLSCDTQLNPQREYIQLQYAFYEGGRTVQEFNISKTYKVRSAQLEDSGNYTCEVRTTTDTVRKNSNTLYVHIQDLMPTPKIQIYPSSLQEGDYMEVKCETSPIDLRPDTQLQYAFYRDGRIVQEFSVSEIYKVWSAQLEDSGNYTCVVKTVTDTVRKSSNAFFIQVKDLFTLPKIKVYPSFTVKEGERVTLECQTVLIEKVINLLFIFYKDSQNIPRMNSKDKYIIDEARVEHTGSYHCSVQVRDQNVPGIKKNSTNVHLIIQQPVSGLSITVDKDEQDFVRGEPLMLNCSVERGTSPVFQWLHNEMVVDEDSELYQLQDNGTVLYISSLQSQHVGTYECNVSNRLPTSRVETFRISHVLEMRSFNNNSIVWLVIGILVTSVLIAVILIFVKRKKLCTFFPFLNCHPKQQNSEPTLKTDNQRYTTTIGLPLYSNKGRTATDSTSRPDETDNQHLYGNVLSRPEESDVCYSYIDIRKKNGPANKKEELSVLYAVLQPPGTATETQAAPKKDDCADVYQNVHTKQH